MIDGAQTLAKALLPRLLARLSGPWKSHGYADGAAGDLLATVVLSRNCPDFDLDTEMIADGVLRLLAGLAAQPHGLYQGAEGILYAALELDRYFGFGMVEDVAQEFDAYLSDCLLNHHDLPDHFDIISGISGLTVYAGYRMSHVGNAMLLEACIERLREISTHEEQCTYWFTPPALSRGYSIAETSPLGYIDLGMAHGQAGVLGALSFALASSDGQCKMARELLQGSLRFMRGQEQRQSLSHFGAKAGEHESTGCAWCYGDLGTLGALRLAAIALEEPLIDNWCESILQTLNLRGAPEPGFGDPWLCHGSMGAAWLLRQVGPGYAELSSRYQSTHLHHGPDGVFQRLAQDPALGILEGATGAALTLTDEQTDAPRWSLPFLAGRDALRNARFVQRPHPSGCGIQNCNSHCNT